MTRLYAAKTIGNETSEERQERLKKMALSIAKSRANQTLEERRERLNQMKLRAAAALAIETPEHRSHRLEMNAKYVAKKREEFLTIMSEDERYEIMAKRNQYNRERYTARKEKISLLIAKGEDDWSSEEQVFFWKYVFDTTSRRRRNRRYRTSATVLKTRLLPPPVGRTHRCLMGTFVK